MESEMQGSSLVWLKWRRIVREMGHIAVRPDDWRHWFSLNVSCCTIFLQQVCLTLGYFLIFQAFRLYFRDLPNNVSQIQLYDEITRYLPSDSIISINIIRNGNHGSIGFSRKSDIMKALSVLRNRSIFGRDLTFSVHPWYVFASCLTYIPFESKMLKYQISKLGFFRYIWTTTSIWNKKILLQKNACIPMQHCVIFSKQCVKNFHRFVI